MASPRSSRSGLRTGGSEVGLWLGFHSAALSCPWLLPLMIVTSWRSTQSRQEALRETESSGSPSRLLQRARVSRALAAGEAGRWTSGFSRPRGGDQHGAAGGLPLGGPPGRLGCRVPAPSLGEDTACLGRTEPSGTCSVPQDIPTPSRARRSPGFLSRSRSGSGRAGRGLRWCMSYQFAAAPGGALGVQEVWRTCVVNGWRRPLSAELRGTLSSAALKQERDRVGSLSPQVVKPGGTVEDRALFFPEYFITAELGGYEFEHRGSWTPGRWMRGAVATPCSLSAADEEAGLEAAVPRAHSQPPCSVRGSRAMAG